MSTPPPNDNEISLLQRRVETLTRSLATDRRRVERKRKTFVAVGGAVTVLCTIGFWTLTSMAFQLDADALATIGRFKVESQLPEGRERVHDYLVAKAPEITSYAIGALMSCVPSVRPYILSQLEKQLATFTAEYEASLGKLLEDSFAASKAELETRYPALSDAERVDKLVSIAAAKFNANVANLYRALYPGYAEQIKLVENYLLGLRNKPEHQLTPREKAEKEMIQTLLALIVREQQAQDAR